MMKLSLVSRLFRRKGGLNNMTAQKKYQKGWKDCANSLLIHYRKMFKALGKDLYETQEEYNRMIDHDHKKEGCECEIDEVDYMRALKK